MYDYEYEDDILLVLRLMKYLHQQDPKALRAALDDYGTFSADTFYESVETMIWEIYSDSYSTGDDDGFVIEAFSHPELDRFCRLGGSWCKSLGCPANVWKRRVQDTVEYYLVDGSYSVWDLQYFYSDASVEVRVWLSPDSYDPVPYGNSLVDLLLYLRRANEQLEALLQGQEAEAGKEAA